MQLEINTRNKTGKFQIRGNKTHLFFFKWIKEEITRKIRKYLNMNESENTAYQNL